MNVELLTIYTLASDGQSFSQFLVDGSPVKLLEYDYVSERMGSTSLTATLKHAKCLDSYWTGREFVVLDEASLQGGTPVGSLEVFFLAHTPSSSKDNTDARYVHTLEFKSRRDILLSGVYFRDSVAAGSASAGKFSSDSYQVKFIGTLDEFVSRFGDVLASLGLQGRFSVSVEQAFQGTTESAELTFDRQTLAQVLQLAYDTWKVPYYFVGDSAVFGDGGATPLPVQYGYDDELLAVQKNNQNAKIVTRITGVGSSENVPYYYPNPTPKGTLGVGGTAQGVEIVDMLKFCRYVGLSDVLTFMGEDAEFVAVRVASQGKNDVQTTLPADAQIENIDLSSGSQSVFLGWLCTNLSGGYDGPIEIGLDANVGSAEGIDPDTDLYHMSWYDDSIPQGYIDAVRKRSYVSEKGWDIAIDRVTVYVGGVNATTRTEIPVPFATVTRDNGITEDDAGLFSPERVCGITVQASDIISRLPAGSDLSQVTVYVVAHLESTALWYASRQGAIGYDRAEFLAQLVEVSLAQYTPRGWYLSGYPLDMTLGEIGLSMSGAPSVGDTITQTVLSKIPATGVLMPAIYRSSGGQSRFYDAQNNTYVNPETQDYWAFEHEYDPMEPHEHVEDFSDIKPSIKNLKDGQGNPLNTLTDVYFDDGYNIEDMLPDGQTLKYSHFFVKLKALGFNLFDCAIEDGEMELVMSDGPCAGCHFRILVTEDGKNPVQKNANGTLKKENGYGVIDEDNIQESQQDTTSTAVWIALSLDEGTFGGTEVENGVMPSYNKTTGAGARPLQNDSYTLANISLPQAFITAAEQELTDALIRFMAENNADKFSYPVTFSRVWLAENPSVRAGLSVRSSLLLTYAGVTLQAPLYVSQMTVSVKEGEALPDIRVETSDIIESRTAGLDEKIAAAVDARVVVGEGGGGLPVDVADARYLRKDADDTAEGTIKFRKGLQVGDYAPGKGGKGGSIYSGSNGEAIAEFDYLMVRRKAVFTQVEVDRIRQVGGTLLLSLAEMTCSAVEEVSGGWKCYFRTTNDEGGAIENGFAVGDQAVCQTFRNDNTHYYWRLVTAVGPDWILLSDVSGQYAADSDAPEVGDIIVQLGSQTDSSRQAAQILSCYGENSPSYVVYAGINSFSLAEKDIFGVVYRETAAGSGVYEPHFFNYGSMLLGSRDKTQEYLEYKNGQLNIKGRLTVMNSQGAYVSMQDYMNAVSLQFDEQQREIDKQTQSWASGEAPTAQTKPYPLWDEETQQIIGTPNFPYTQWLDDTERAKHVGDSYVDDSAGQSYRLTKKTVSGTTVYYWTRITDEEISQAISTSQQAYAAAEALQYLKSATNEGTLVDGGLVLTSMIQLGYTPQGGAYTVMSGINGKPNTQLQDPTRSIAAWYGGPMIDHETYPSVQSYAKSLFRMDGSGYLASGNIHWDNQGYGGIPGIGWSQSGGQIVVTIDGNVKFASPSGASAAALNSVAGFFDSSDKLKYANLPDLYLARTKVKSAAAQDTLLGVTAISNAAASDATDKSRIEWDDTNKAWHFYGNIYTDGWWSGRGVSPGGGGGGGGIDPTAMWSLLGAPTSEPINSTHISFPVTSVAGYTGAVSAAQIAAALGLGSLAYKSSLLASDIPDLSGTYLPLTGGTISTTRNNPIVFNTSATYNMLVFQKNGVVKVQVGYYPNDGAVLQCGNCYIEVREDTGALQFYDGTTGRSVYHSGNFTPSDYLPLSAGSSHPLTGDLYLGSHAISGATTITSSGEAFVGGYLHLGNGGGIIDSIRSNGVSYNLDLQFTSTGGITMCYGGGNVAIGLINPNSSYKLYVNGDSYCNGAFVSAGKLYADGQARFLSGYFNQTMPSLGALGNGTISIEAVNSAGASVNYGLYAWVDYWTGSSYIQNGSNSGGTGTYPIVLQPLGGNVGIGTPSPSHKVEISSSDGIPLQIISSQSYVFLDFATGGGTSRGQIGYYPGDGILMQNGNNYVEVSDSGALRYYANNAYAMTLSSSGVLYVTTGIWTDGYFSGRGLAQTSDERDKGGWRDITFTLADIVNAPAGSFAWLNAPGRSAGTTAQYWQKYTPELVGTKPDGKLSLEYGPLAFLIAHKTAEELYETNTKVDKQGEELRRVKEELGAAKIEINNLRARLGITS